MTAGEHHDEGVIAVRHRPIRRRGDPFVPDRPSPDGVLSALAGLFTADQVGRRDATVMSQARGLAGMPSAGHCLAPARRASCTASSAVAKWP